jgi:hypothetical protein
MSIKKLTAVFFLVLLTQQLIGCTNPMAFPTTTPPTAIPTRAMPADEVVVPTIPNGDGYYLVGQYSGEYDFRYITADVKDAPYWPWYYYLLIDQNKMQIQFKFETRSGFADEFGISPSGHARAVFADSSTVGSESLIIRERFKEDLRRLGYTVITK